MSTVIEIGSFVPSTEHSHHTRSDWLTFSTWTEWKREDKKHAIFLKVCSLQMFQQLCSLSQSKDLKDVSYVDLISTTLKHYDPAPSPIVQCFKFHTREKQSSETDERMLIKWRTLLNTDFPADTMNKMAWDHLICGIKDGHIQRALYKSLSSLTRKPSRLLKELRLLC